MVTDKKTDTQKVNSDVVTCTDLHGPNKTHTYTTALSHTNDAVADADLRNWLLIALGARNGQKEIISIDHQANEVQGTFPLPSTMRKMLCLMGEPTGKWQRYAITNAVSAASLLRHCFSEVRVE